LTAARRARRPNRTASVHLTLTPESELRLRGYAVLLGVDASEVVMDLVDVATAGMHFYIPGGPGLGLAAGTTRIDAGQLDGDAA
jgi:hypothetical protein